ncbi:hypothetical protein NEFER03_0865 [Nematocida sp. LUAm3]|nr:hypothetical protein NEFER03_0865 [Nematocida sp. LUAm3]KAI5174883.1 hypothetical protein NEFER02_0983 [Nematocida sp. LUAm2]KAI5177519.1 hypothetical protein NEFER01_0769 [Nematocida sp. LUAm1]
MFLRFLYVSFIYLEQEFTIYVLLYIINFVAEMTVNIFYMHSILQNTTVTSSVNRGFLLSSAHYVRIYSFIFIISSIIWVSSLYYLYICFLIASERTSKNIISIIIIIVSFVIISFLILLERRSENKKLIVLTILFVYLLFISSKAIITGSLPIMLIVFDNEVILKHISEKRNTPLSNSFIIYFFILFNFKSIILQIVYTIYLLWYAYLILFNKYERPPKKIRRKVLET